jgi:glycosyltransferase involved in cell wall biosynthesis
MTIDRSGRFRIVMVEPVCRGFEHVRVNAGVLCTILLAFPDAEVDFFGEREHRTGVQRLASERFPSDASRVHWHDALIPPRHSGTAGKLPVECRLLWSVFRRVRRDHVDLVFFCSASETTFFLLKVFLLALHRHVPVLAAAHGVLATLVSHAGKRFLGSLRGMRLVLRLPHPRQFAYVLFGEVIRNSLKEFSATASRKAVVMDLPYLWDEGSIPLFVPGGTPRFSFFGASGGRGKGFDRFAAVAAELRQNRPGVVMSLVGHLSTDRDREQYREVLPGASSRSLTQEEYAAAARKSTYAVSTGDPDVYRFGASSSFLDALSFLKPGIYLENPYLKECFRSMGDIGYLCASMEEVKATVMVLADGIPEDRYRSQQKAILSGRKMFDPVTIAPAVKGAIETLRHAIR